MTEEDLIPLSALQHLLFCERQCALIHVERLWAENPLTVEGRQLHERTDEGEGETQGDVRIARNLPLRSLKLGLTGRSDVVELHRWPDGGDPDSGAVLPDLPGRWRLFPVEYKRGRPKPHRADEVQLCAQGLCLEEMLGAHVPQGALFYGQTRRRTEVLFDRELRQLTEETATRLHALIRSRSTPPPVYEPKCDSCSLIAFCMPAAPGRSARSYITRFLRQIEPLP